MADRRMISALLCALTVVVAPYAAAATSPAPVAELTGETLTTEAVESALESMLANRDLSEEEKQAARELYAKALEQVALADTWRTKVAQFDAVISEAPGLLAAIKQELATPISPAPPQVPEGASVSELDQLAAQSEAELAVVQKEAADLDTEVKFRTERRSSVPALAAKASQRLIELTEQLNMPPLPGENALVTQARRLLLASERQAVELELSAYDKEILSYTTRGELLTARRDRAARRVSIANAKAESWRNLAAEVRRREAQKAAREAEEARNAATMSHDTVRRLADENAVLALRRREVTANILTISPLKRQVSELLSELVAKTESVDTRIKLVGLTRTVSVLLRKQREELPDLQYHESIIRKFQAESADIQLELFELHEKPGSALDTAAEARDIVARLLPPVDEDSREEMEATVAALIEAKRENLAALTKDLEQYFEDLIELLGKEQQLVLETHKRLRYIEENVLWFKSDRPFGMSQVADTWQGLRWLADPGNWSEVAQVLARDVRDNPVLYVIATAGFAVLLVLRRRTRKTMGALATLVDRAYTDRFYRTLAALLMTAVLAAWWALLAGFLSIRILTAAENSRFAQAVAEGLKTLVPILAATLFLRESCREHGLAEVHFQWRGAGLRELSRQLAWFTVVLLAGVFVLVTADWQQEDTAWKGSLGRLSLVAVLVALSVFSQRALRTRGTLMADVMARNRNGWLDRLRYLWYPAAVIVPLLLAIMALVGYYDTALELTARLFYTAWLLVAIVFANALILRWLFVAHRRFALSQSRAAAKTHEHADELGDQVEEPHVDIFQMSSQTRRLARSFIAAALLVGLWFIWAQVLPALSGLQKIVLWGAETDHSVNLANLVQAILVVIMTIIAGRNIPGLLEMTVLQRLPLDHGVRYAISSVARYVITVVGVIVAFGVIGIGWSKVQWLVAAMTVGLGFGLQEIFGNFISGLIILFERPMRIGDTVTVKDITGTVTRIQIRATTIRDWNRKELVVPNKEFITGQIINWTLSDPILRLTIPVGIAYGSDTKLARATLLKVAHDHPDVLSEPEPQALFMGFGDSSLNFELRIFIPSVEYYIPLWDQMHTQIDNAFREAKVEIAFPQRDIHVRSIRDVLTVGGPPPQESVGGTA